MGYLFLWLICAFIAGIIYQNKGKSQTTGALLGLLLGPIGVVIALVVAPDVREVERRQLASREMDMCPFCSELVRPTAVVCKHCGRDLPVAGAKQP